MQVRVFVISVRETGVLELHGSREPRYSASSISEMDRPATTSTPVSTPSTA